MRYLKYILLYIVSFLIRDFVKIKKDLLVFGARGGAAFEDNPKYLFLYGNLYTNYNCIWISKNKESVQHIRSLGYKAEYYFSLRALLISLKSNAVFITHSLSDVMPIFYNRSSKIINLWHGIPIKKIEFLDKNISLKGKVLNYIKSKRTSYFISNNESFNNIYKECFKIQSDKIKALGNPRIQYLYDPNKFYEDTQNPFQMDKKVYLYVPTFSDYHRREVLDDNLLKDINQIMEKESGNFYIKLHPFDKRNIDVTSYKNIFFMTNDYNTQEALQYVDVLITDYSSVVFDFMVLDRPVILFCNDLEKYKTSRGFIIDFENMFENIIARNSSEFINKLKHHKDCRVKSHVKRKVLSKEVYNSCEYIYELLE